MDWRRTALTLTVIGLIGLAVGFVWRDTVNDEAITCQLQGLRDCEPSGTPTVVMLMGLAALVVGLALRAGVSARPSADSSTE